MRTITTRLICGLAISAVLTGCSNIEKVRGFSDAAVVGKETLSLQALRQGQVERQRVRAARCHSPLLTPATVSAAAAEADLGDAWVDELLRDCPEFSTFLSNLVVKRARMAGLCAR
jgi:hypothetical protein